MAAKKDTSAMDFIVASIKKNRHASYADVKQSADAKGLTIFPIMYGRAQALLGYVKVRPRGQGKAAVAKAAKTAVVVGAPVKRGPGRPPKSAAARMDLSSLDGIISAVRNSEAAKSRYRTALDRIQAILADALN